MSSNLKTYIAFLNSAHTSGLETNRDWKSGQEGRGGTKMTKIFGEFVQSDPNTAHWGYKGPSAMVANIVYSKKP